MGQNYVDAVKDALASIRDVLVELALPVGILVGLSVVAFAIILAKNSEAWNTNREPFLKIGGRMLGWTCLGLLTVCLWATLSEVRPLAQQSLEWRESAEATTNATPDAPPIYQFGPAAASLVEHTYSRSLTLPSDFLQRIGAEGLSVLSPYLSDPTAENVLKLQDKFTRTGNDVVFTRESTQMEEQPIAFDSSNIKTTFKNLAGTAYDAEFQGDFQFTNTTSEPIKARFSFPLPEGGTIRDLSITVGGQAVAQSNQSDAYEWEGDMAPGEKKVANARYKLVGARQWSYDMGSRRRRVQQFRLETNVDGPVRFMRGSIQPTSKDGNALTWDMNEVITQQRIGLQFPPKTAAKEAFLQSLSMLPASMVLFLICIGLFGLRFGAWPSVISVAAALALFTIGLGAAPIIAGYAGSMAGVIAGPILGAFLACWAIGWKWLQAGFVAALLPAPFLSPENSGAIMLLLAIGAIVAWRMASTKAQ